MLRMPDDLRFPVVRGQNLWVRHVADSLAAMRQRRAGFVMETESTGQFERQATTELTE